MATVKFSAQRQRPVEGQTKAEFIADARTRGYEARYSGKAKRFFLVKLRNPLALNLPDYVKQERAMVKVLGKSTTIRKALEEAQAASQKAQQQ